MPSYSTDYGSPFPVYTFYFIVYSWNLLDLVLSNDFYSDSHVLHNYIRLHVPRSSTHIQVTGIHYNKLLHTIQVTGIHYNKLLHIYRLQEYIIIKCYIHAYRLQEYIIIKCYIPYRLQKYIIINCYTHTGYRNTL